MSSPENTQKKLISSIQKARKAAAEPEPSVTSSDAGKSRPTPARRGGTGARRTAPRKSRAAKAATKADAPARGSSGYQAGRRVWPD